MDRVSKYFGSLVQETDLLQSQQDGMIALGWGAQAAFGVLPNANPSTFASAVDGFTCVPTTPSASLNVVLTPGAVYQYAPVEATLWSSLPANTAQSIVKQGLMQSNDSISIPVPGTVGFSQVYLIEVQYADLDANPVLLPYFNFANPAQPFSGPANNGQSQNTARLGIASVRLKAGVAAATGTQITPTQDAGWVGIFTVTVAQGQTTITAGNIAIVNAAPWIPTKLPVVPSSVLNGTWVYCQDTGTANVYVGGVTIPGFVPTTLLAGMSVRLRILNTNTGASTFNFSGLGPAAIVRANLAALQANDLIAGAVIDLTYDGTHWQIVNYYSVAVGGTTTNNFSTGLPYCVDSGTVNNIIAPFSPAIASGAYVAGLAVLVKISNTVSGATKITVNSFTQTNVIMPDGSATQSGDLKAGMVLLLVFDGTNFQVASWQDAVAPIKIMELSGVGQSFNANVLTLITCFTSINRNTLQTSAWNGSTLTVGVGEDGLWSIYSFAELTGSVTSGPYYDIVAMRTRAIGGVQEFYWATGTTIPQPSAAVLIDLAVGDTVQLFLVLGSTGNDHIITLGVGGNYANAIFTRIEGLH